MIRRAFLTLSFFCSFFFWGHTSVWAAIGNACDYEVNPTVIRPGESAQVRIGLEPGGPRAICDQDGVDDNCYQIRTCDESSYLIGYYCHNNANFHAENQQIIANWQGSGIDVIQASTGPLRTARRFWLEKKIGGSNNNNYCPGNYRDGQGPRVSVVGGCDEGWASVRATGGEVGHRLTTNDNIELVYDADYTFGFNGGFAVGITRGDGSEYRRLGDVMSRPFDQQGRLDASFMGSTFNLGPLAAGEYKFMIVDANILGRSTYCEYAFNVCAPGDERCSLTQATIKGAEKTADKTPIDDFNYCNQVPVGEQRTACMACVGNDAGEHIYTAVGCLQLSQTGLVADLIRLLLGIAGGVALLAILLSAFTFSTSQGDSNKVKRAKEMMTAAVSGLFFIIFSVIVLNFIGVQILRIPGLG